jgi:hypothetical protein
VDSRTKKIVGILNEATESPDRIALAVPIQELSDFVMRVQPYLQAALFPKSVFVSPVAADLYAPYVWPHDNHLSSRPGETHEVSKLRSTAQHLADSMWNFSSIQTFAWGSGNRAPDATDSLETLMTDDGQRWRRPGSKKFYERIPFPSLDEWVIPGSEWSSLPQLVGWELNLKIHQAPNALVGGRTIQVFQYAASVEDRVCSFEYVTDFGLFMRYRSRFYDCHGEVWVDELGNILRISEFLDLSGPASHVWIVMTYGWIEKNGLAYPVPATISTQVEKQKKIYWCRGLFTDYELFGVKTRMTIPTL